MGHRKNKFTGVGARPVTRPPLILVLTMQYPIFLTIAIRAGLRPRPYKNGKSVITTSLMGMF